MDVFNNPYEISHFIHQHKKKMYFIFIMLQNRNLHFNKKHRYVLRFFIRTLHHEKSI